MTFSNGDFVVHYKLNGQNPFPQHRVLKFEHHMTDDKLHKAVFVFENFDNRLAKPELIKQLTIGSKVSFQYGYLGKSSMSQTYEYVIKGHKGYHELTVECYPHYTGLEQQRTRTFKQSKRSDVIKAIMGPEMKLNTKYVTDTECIEKNLSQAKESNWKWMEDAANKLHWTFGIVAAKEPRLFFGPRSYKQKPEFVFQYKLNLNSGKEFPISNNILSFNPSKNMFQIPGAIDVIYQSATDGKSEKSSADSKSTQRQTCGPNNSPLENPQASPDSKQKKEEFYKQSKAKPVPQKIVKGPNGKLITQPVYPKHNSKRDKDLATCRAEDLFKAIEDKILSADLVLMGCPNLRDRTVVTLVNLGAVYNGNWYVQEVIHRMDTSVGYECVCKVETNSAYGDKASCVGKATKAKPNGTAGVPANAATGQTKESMVKKSVPEAISRRASRGTLAR